MFHTHPATACLHSIIFSFLHQHRYTLINDVLGYCYCYCYYCVLIASYLRRAYSVYFILYPLRCSGKKLMMKYETLPNFFFSIFCHTSSFFSSRFHNVCYCLLFIKKLFRSEEGSRVLRMKKFSSFVFCQARRMDVIGAFQGNSSHK